MPLGPLALWDVSSSVHALLAQVLQRPPAATQLLDLGAKGGTGGFAVIWSDAGVPKAPWMWVPLEEARSKLHPGDQSWLEAGWRAVAAEEEEAALVSDGEAMAKALERDRSMYNSVSPVKH